MKTSTRSRKPAQPRPAAGPEPFKRGNETQRTYQLKWAAWEWLYTVVQCRCIGLEVRLEGPTGRVADVVGVGPENAIYVIEVKSSRADLSRDNHTADDLASLQDQTQAAARRTDLAQQTLSQATDYARQAQPEAWQDVAAYQQALFDYRRLAKREEAYKARLTTFSTKFYDPRFLAIADYHYILAPRGLIPRRRVPPQWGLLDDTPAVVVPAPRKVIRKTNGIVSNVLRAIARSNTTAMMRAQGVQFTEEGAVFP